MLPALLVLAGVFGVLLLLRLSVARRHFLEHRWPAIAFAGAAIFVLTRGAVWSSLALGVLAVALWFAGPSLFRRRPAANAVSEDPATQQARRVLGVGPQASESEIRGAYRAKMAKAHPDRGGSHAEAARLTAARDLLLRRRR